MCQHHGLEGSQKHKSELSGHLLFGFSTIHCCKFASNFMYVGTKASTIILQNLVGLKKQIKNGNKVKLKDVLQK